MTWAIVLGMWLDWRHADAGVGIGMPALVGPSWREGVGKRKTENGKRKMNILSNHPHQSFQTAAVGSVLKS